MRFSPAGTRAGPPRLSASPQSRTVSRSFSLLTTRPPQNPLLNTGAYCCCRRAFAATLPARPGYFLPASRKTETFLAAAKPAVRNMHKCIDISTCKMVRLYKCRKRRRNRTLSDEIHGEPRHWKLRKSAGRGLHAVSLRDTGQ